ncbi:DnaJ (Hsp40), sub B, member 12 [Dermatophagoides farinae]|uniref:DnaJ (Hsp40), sub B, member 12 n=1 Tax=Dermatophagoides farinae TaxID=6954 RepID=A0A922L3N8_DERFA|nr:DnaJ (Hsp40), sub B, member 12 [Dermatophagoides farinae]
MEGNKDESKRCMAIAEQALSRKDFNKAVKFAQKADQLYSTEVTKNLLNKAKLLAESRHNPTFDDSSNSTNNHQRKNSESSTNNNMDSEQQNQSSSSSSTTTNDQPKSVDYIRNCKDYYEILSVSKQATEKEIKTQYRKLALQFHPDKNKEPGAAEAFKAIGNAFAVLSDPDKRRKYDQIGTIDDSDYPSFSSSRRRGYDYSRGFEDFNADEIFNMFFGGGFPTGNVYVYRNGNGGWNQHHSHHHQQQRTNRQHESQATAGYTVLLQILPILFFICISLLSNLVPDNPYSLQRSHKYPYQRFTENLEVPYFVKENFERDYRDSLSQIERHVEESYISNLQTSCFKERNYKENLIYRARFLRDTTMESKAQALKTPSCDRLAQMQKEYY